MFLLHGHQLEIKMRLRELFENIYEAGGAEDVAIMFGRFNPPHFGHVDAWKVAADFPEWYIGTNQSTQGPKDPLPHNIKIEAMTTLYPKIEGHLVAEQTWFTLAAMVYKKHGPITLHIVTDDKDVKIYLPMIQKQNGIEGPHGYYRFKDIVWAEAERKSEASLVRKAVKENNPQDFEKYSGVPANTVVAGHPYFKLVRHFMLPYMQAEEEKVRKQQERDQLKAEKAAKAVAKTKKAATKTQPTEIDQPEDYSKTPMAEGSSGRIGKGGTKPIDKEKKAAMKNATTLPGLNMATGSMYKNYRMGIALAGAPTYPTKIEADNWIGGDPLISSYTEEEYEMVKAAAKQVGAGTIQNWSGDRSKEIADVNKTSPIAKPKKNRYGV